MAGRNHQAGQPVHINFVATTCEHLIAARSHVAERQPRLVVDVTRLRGPRWIMRSRVVLQACRRVIRVNTMGGSFNIARCGSQQGPTDLSYRRARRRADARDIATNWRAREPASSMGSTWRRDEDVDTIRRSTSGAALQQPELYKACSMGGDRRFKRQSICGPSAAERRAPDEQESVAVGERLINTKPQSRSLPTT